MKSFQELKLIEPVLSALADADYERPTPVQARTIPPALAGSDVLGCAQTGTGKTAAFALPILHRLGEHNRKAVPNRPFALVLAPTRELAGQIGQSFQTYGKHLRLRTTLVYGGVGQGKQVRALSRGTHILVATPGRLLDLMQQGHIRLNLLSVFVLDEADRMLDMGFLPDIRRVIDQLPDQRQSLFFSATLAPKIVTLSRRLLTEPVNVNVTPKTTCVVGIRQSVFHVEQRDKQELLLRTVRDPGVDRVLVFARTKRGANVVAARLVRSGVTATAIHGNKSQNARQRALEQFRSNQVQVLVATDVAARGLDVPGVAHVVNFDLPNDPECYVHRIGRTGRAGAEGTAISFCARSERSELRAIERLIGKRVPPASGQAEPTDRTSNDSGSDTKHDLPRQSAPRATNNKAKSRTSRRRRNSRRRVNQST